jgi:hypothetical protein
MDRMRVFVALDGGLGIGDWGLGIVDRRLEMEEISGPEQWKRKRLRIAARNLLLAGGP